MAAVTGQETLSAQARYTNGSETKTITYTNLDSEVATANLTAFAQYVNDSILADGASITKMTFVSKIDIPLTSSS